MSIDRDGRGCSRAAGTAHRADFASCITKQRWPAWARHLERAAVVKVVGACRARRDAVGGDGGGRRRRRPGGDGGDGATDGDGGGEGTAPRPPAADGNVLGPSARACTPSATAAGAPPSDQKRPSKRRTRSRSRRARRSRSQPKSRRPPGAQQLVRRAQLRAHGAARRHRRAVRHRADAAAASGPRLSPQPPPAAAAPSSRPPPPARPPPPPRVAAAGSGGSSSHDHMLSAMQRTRRHFAISSSVVSQRASTSGRGRASRQSPRSAAHWIGGAAATDSAAPASSASNATAVSDSGGRRAPRGVFARARRTLARHPLPQLSPGGLQAPPRTRRRTARGARQGSPLVVPLPCTFPPRDGRDQSGKCGGLLEQALRARELSRAAATPRVLEHQVARVE